MDLLKPSAANLSPITPVGFLERAATVYGDCTSIIYNETTFTWKQTNRRCLQLASALKSVIGIERGDVISVLSPNLPAMYELHFAVPMSGAILNTISTRLDARTISHFLISHQKFNSMLILINDDEDDVENSLFTFEFNLEFTYERLLMRGDLDFQWERPHEFSTTSSPKGVVHSHRGLFIATVDALVDWSVPKQPIFLWTLAMFHSNGWCFPWGMAAVGATNICVRKFDAVSVYNLLRQHKVTHMCAAPVVLNMLANEPGIKPLPNRVHILTAGAPPPAPVLLRTESLGFLVSHGYGLTETASIVVSCAWKPEWNKLPATQRARLKARQGVKTLGMTEIDVLDPESGASVKRDGFSLGEIVLRGGSILLGYLKDPIGTSKCLKEDGWFYTGDVGVMHPDGYLEIKDRSKDVIISGGENISSVEVESILYSHPAIHEAAVVARPDEYWGETPCAFVSLKPEKIHKPSQKDIIEFCRVKMPHYMVPKTVVFIQKFMLREKAKAMGTAARLASRI
ncbi:hypothetical protein MKW92_021076 [Papaver armeniacum]|nr:hypothetical protein MKW92_021076 [Papaver armeniacum]